MNDTMHEPRTPQEVAAIERLTTAMVNAATDRVEASIPPLVALLTSVEADPIVLKGPVTRRRLYALDERRPVADVDILVDARAFGRAGRALVSEGYARVDRHGHSDAFHSLRKDAPDVDLHLTLPYVKASPRKAFAIFSAHATALEVAGRPIPVLDEPAHVVHLAIHCAVNGFDTASRTFAEWSRGLDSLDAQACEVAERVADELGVLDVWDLACEALTERTGVESTSRSDLADRLPTWEAVPRVWSIRGFVSSGTPLRVKWRDFERLVALQLSDSTVNVWRAKRDHPPLASGSWRIRFAKVLRLVVVSARGMGRGVNALVTKALRRD